MSRTLARGPTIALVAALGVAFVLPAAPAAENLPSPHATLVRTRWGARPSGATRIVFELDRRVEYRTVEVAGDGGLEVHLLGVDAESLPDLVRMGSGGVADVSFRPDPTGVVARIAPSGVPLSSKSFRLDDPPRVVLDVTPARAGEHVEAPAPVARPKPAEPEPTAKPELATPEPVVKPAPVAKPPPAAEPQPTATPAPEPPPAAARTDAACDEIFAWIHDLAKQADGVEHGGSAMERAGRRRSLALLLAERGLPHEAETLLTSALESGDAGDGTALSDSLRLAELRLQTGDVEGAAGIALQLHASGRGAPQRVRLARILTRSGLPELAVTSLEEALPDLEGRQRAEAQLALARAYWNRKNMDKARTTVREVTQSRSAPPDLIGPALVLEADCAWARDRTAESERLYRRALQEHLDDEDACWVTLQLGNAARRDGRRTDAIEQYRNASERWPDTFYGAQAGWFLRVTEQAGSVADTEAATDRG